MRPVLLASLVFIPPVSGLGQEQLLQARLMEWLHPQGRNGPGSARACRAGPVFLSLGAGTWTG